MFCRGPECGYQPTACVSALSVAGPYVPYASGGLVPALASWKASTALVVALLVVEVSQVPVTLRGGHP